MNKEKITAVLIRHARLREEFKPILLLTGEPPESIKADWIGISHSVSKLPHRSDELESYIVNFYSDDGELLEALQFDTLDIALDQAKAIAGIEVTEWRKCNMPVPHDGRVSWSVIERKG